MGHPARNEIEKHAKDEFAVAQERIAIRYGEEKHRELLQVSKRGNIGGYVPALTELAAKRVRRQLIALADAYVKTFNFFGVPSDVEAERSLESAGRQIAAGSISAVRGEIELIEKRLQRPLHNTGGLVRKIEQTRQSAMNAGKLLLKRQRIQFKKLALENVLPTHRVSDQKNHPATEAADVPNRAPRPLDTKRINLWIGENGYTNATLAIALKTTAKTVSSLRNNGRFHGSKATNKLANLMGCEYVSELYLE